MKNKYLLFSIEESVNPYQNPEERLLWAMVIRGVRDLFEPEHKDEVLDWFRGDRKGLIPFRYIQDHITISAKVQRVINDGLAGKISPKEELQFRKRTRVCR